MINFGHFSYTQQQENVRIWTQTGTKGWDGNREVERLRRGECEKEREREKDREKRERERDGAQRERDGGTEKERQTDRQTQRDRDTERDGGHRERETALPTTVQKTEFT